MLTSEQYNELESRCRSVGLSLESYISKLSQWLFSKGKHCTDPYRIISGWLDNDSKRKTAAKPKNKQGCDLSWYDDFAMNVDLSRQQQGSAAKNSPPTILNLQQILSTGEHCSPLQMLPIVSSAAKSLRSVLGITLCLVFTLFSFAHSSLKPSAPPI